MRGKEHHSPKCVVRPPSSLFTFLATTQQAIETLVRDPRVVSLHASAGYFPTTARRAQYPRPPSWGPKRLCKQTLNSKFRGMDLEVSIWSAHYWATNAGSISENEILQSLKVQLYQQTKNQPCMKFVTDAVILTQSPTFGGTSLSGKRHFARLLRTFKSCAYNLQKIFTCPESKRHSIY